MTASLPSWRVAAMRRCRRPGARVAAATGVPSPRPRRAAMTLCLVASSLAASPALAAAAPSLHCEVRVNVEIGDGGLRVWQELTLATAGPGELRWDGGAPLTLPLVAPVVGDVVLDRGVLPANAGALQTEVAGEATVTVDAGSATLVGVVAPGRAVTVRLRYPIKIDGGSVELGVRGVGATTDVLVAALAAEPAEPRLLTRDPARVGVHRDGEQRLAGYARLQALRHGEIARWTLTDLPDRPTRPGELLQRGAAAAAALVAGLLLALRGARVG